MPHPDSPAAPGGDLTPEAQAAHTRRVNACLKAFGDMPTELIEDMQDDLVELMASTEEEVQNLTAQRDELLAALKGVVAVADRKTDEFDRARAAIARVEGLL